MRRRRIRMKLKGRRRDSTKKVRPLCDFCGFSSSIRYEHERDHESMSLENELRKLRLLTRRMTGKDLDGLLFTDLLSLQSHLKNVLLTVGQRKRNLQEAERQLEQEKEDEDEDNGTRGEDLVVPFCNFSTSSIGERQDDESTLLLRKQIAFERRNSESMLIEYERLWVLKERLNGRELDGMNSDEMALLEDQIHYGWLNLHELFSELHMGARKRREEVDLSVKRCSRI